MNDIFLKVLRGEEAPYTPVWIMRQAGRYLRRVRPAAIRFPQRTARRLPVITP